MAPGEAKKAGILLIDIDFFEHCNEHYVHPKGDKHVTFSK
jgi:GGDEF domain-containing protein